MDNKYYQNYQTNRGIIITDIMIALTLAALFASLITASSLDSRRLFDRAKERSDLLDDFESGKNIRTAGRLYGNDRVQNDITVSSSTHSQSITFRQIAMRFGDNFSDYAGTPLCSVDFSLLKPMISTSSTQAAVSINPITLPVSPLISLTDLQVRNGIAYVSADSSISSDPDLFVFDINNRSNPALLSSINTGPGISAIALAGKRVFAAAASTAGQLHVIRFDGLNSPALEKKYRLPLPYATATPPVASSVFYDRYKIYLGTTKWDGDELSVIDVSNPTNPIKVGGLKTGSKVNGIFVLNGIAYIAASDQKQLRLIDVGDSANPTLIDSFSPSGWQRQEGKSVSLFEDNLNFGRTSGGFNIKNDHELFSWPASSSSSSLLPTLQIPLPPPNSLDIPGGVYGIVADRGHLYAATRDINKEFQIFDLSLSASSSVAYSLPIAPRTIVCDGGRIYILAATAPIIYEIDFNN